MRRRALLLSISVLAVVAGCFLWNGQDSQSVFTPRADQEAAAEINGATEISNRLRANIETGEVNEEDYINLRKAAAKRANSRTKAAPDVQWEEMGPDNIGGRIRAVYIEEDNTTIWTGGISGGLWRSTNAGNNWTQITSFPNCMVASINRNGNGRFYVGTGSIYDSGSGNGGSGFRGRGVYSSTDGINWEIIEDTDPGLFGGGDWTACDALAPDPNNPARMWYGSNAGYGYFDEDVTFEGVSSDLNTDIGDIAIAPDGSYMLVSSSNGRIYRSTDGNFLNFESVSDNDPGYVPTSAITRARVDISPDDSNHAYVLLSQSGSFGGVHYSSNAGNAGSWGNIWPTGVPNVDPLPRGQGNYDLALGVKKGDPELAFIGGIELWKCGPSTQAEQAAFAFDFPGSEFGVHADVHEVQFANNGEMYVATDGGIYKSLDGGITYTASNRNLNITQFYGIAYSAGSAVMGGTQDNGTLLIPADGTLTTNQEAFEVLGGDGFDCAISQVTEADQSAAFAMSQNGGLSRFTDDGAGGPFFDDDIIALANEDGDIGQFYSVCQLHENTQDENSQQFIILVNPFEETVTDTTFELATLNQNLPFDYTLSEGEELRFWEELVRPELNVDAEITEDPNYFWLDPQPLTELQINCTTDSVEIGTEIVIVDIEPIDSCTVFLGEIICVPIGADTTFAEMPIYEYSETCDSNYFYASDTLFNVREQIRIQDPYTSLFAVGFEGAQGVWVTREAVNFNTTPDWWRVGNAPVSGGTKSIEFTKDGNHMFVTGWDGTVTRYSGFENVWSEEDLDNLEAVEIFDSSGVATGLSIDPQDANHVVVSIGGYGTVSSGKVVETFNALGANPSWDNIWVANNDPIAPMPIYDVVIDYTDPEVILVGTEHGVYATDNGGDDWDAVNLGMAPVADAVACPVHALKQQWRGGTNWSYPANTGVIYAGSHGRGIFRSGTLVGVDEAENGIDQAQELFTVYPNPNNSGNLNMNLDLDAATDVVVQIFSLQGKLVLTENLGQMSGEQQIQLDINALANGQYVIRVAAGSSSKVSKFVVLK